MLNVSAGIGVLGQASVMIQEMFSEKVMGAKRAVNAVAAGGFVGLLSLFNMAGRFFWSSLYFPTISRISLSAATKVL